MKPSDPCQEPVVVAFLEQTCLCLEFSLGMWMGQRERFQTRNADQQLAFSSSFSVICGARRFGRMSSLISRTLERSLPGHSER